MDLEQGKRESKLSVPFLSVPHPETFSREALRSIDGLSYYFEAMSITNSIVTSVYNQRLSESDQDQLRQQLPVVAQRLGVLLELRDQTEKLNDFFPLRKSETDPKEETKAKETIDTFFADYGPRFEQPTNTLVIKDQDSLDLILLKMSLVVDHDLKNKLAVVSAYAQMANREVNREVTDDEKLTRFVSIIEGKSQEIQKYLTEDVLKFLLEEYHQDEVPADINKVRQSIQRHLKVKDYALGMDVELNIGEIPEELNDLKIGLPSFLIESVLTNLASNAGKAALLRQDAENPDLMKPDKVPLSHVEPQVEVEFLPLNQTSYQIPESKRALLDPNKDYILIVTKDNFIGYPESFVDNGFTGLSIFKESQLPHVTGTGVGMVGMERFIKPYGSTFILQNRSETLGAVTIWAIPVTSL